MVAPLLTFHDAIETLLDSYAAAGKAQRETLRNARRAVQEAAFEMPSLANWRYLRRQTMIHTDATYSTGTVEYVSATRNLELTGGTWPTNAAAGTVTIANVVYVVSRRIDDTNLQLDAEQCPSANVAAGTTYTWQRYRYLLPVDVGSIIAITDARNSSSLIRTPGDVLFWANDILSTETFPTMFNMVRSRDYPGRWELWVPAASSTSRPLRIYYHARFASGVIDEIKQGTVSVTANTDLATFSKAVVTEHVVGCVLRLGQNDAAPTPFVGGHNGVTEQETSLPVAERVIIEMLSTTTARLAAPVASTVTDQLFTISSHIDATPSMWPLFSRLVQLKYHAFRQSDAKQYQLAQSQYLSALRAAKIADTDMEGEDETYRIREAVIEES